MGIVYQLTFLVSLGMLGIIIAIFVMTVAQIGKATELATKQQGEMLLQQKEAKENQISRIQDKLKKAKKTGKLDEFEEEIRKTKEEVAYYDREMERIKERVVLIRRRGAVVYPGVASCVMLALAGTSSGLTESQNLSSVAFWLWILSMCALIYVIYRVFKTLGAIEQVTITSAEFEEKLPEAVKYAKEELEEQSLPQALLYALRELENEKRVAVELVVIDEEIPINIGVNDEKKITISLVLKKGDVVRKPLLYIFAPPGFEFVGVGTWVQSKMVTSVGGYTTTKIELEDCRQGVTSLGTVTIKAPDEPGSYSLYYRATCEGTSTDLTELKVIVK